MTLLETEYPGNKKLLHTPSEVRESERQGKARGLNISLLFPLPAGWLGAEARVCLPWPPRTARRIAGRQQASLNRVSPCSTPPKLSALPEGGSLPLEGLLSWSPLGPALFRSQAALGSMM